MSIQTAVTPIAFLENLLTKGPLQIGQLTLKRDGASYLLAGPEGEGALTEIDLPTESFRQWIRRTDQGAYRPLSGAANLRSGWFRRCTTMEQLAEDLEVVYPMALQHLHLQARGCLPVVIPEETLARQGVLKSGQTAAPGLEGAVTATLCSRCVRTPVWRGEPATGGGTLPCPEPCSFWVSLVREAAGWGGVLPARVSADEAVGFAEFARGGNAIREDLLRRLASTADEGV